MAKMRHPHRDREYLWFALVLLAILAISAAQAPIDADTAAVSTLSDSH